MWLIDKDKLPKYTGYALSANEVAIAVENAPAVDAVSVVRCKDCKHFVKSEGVCYLLSNFYEPTVDVDEDDFCSYGERKGGDEEVGKE